MEQEHGQTREQTQALAAASTYEKFFVPVIGTPAAEQLLAAADLRPGERVLDVGCGTGAVTRLAAEAVGAEGTVAGADVNPAMLAVAGRAIPAGAAVDWYWAPAEALPPDDDTFDVVLCQMALQFFEQRVEALREMRRVLADGGRALVSLPGPMTPLFAALDRALARHLGAGPAGFLRQVFALYEPDEIAGLLREGGFESVEVHSQSLHLSLPGAAQFLDGYVRSTPLVVPWNAAEESVRAAVRDEVLEAWRPLEGENGLEGEQPMVVAIAA